MLRNDIRFTSSLTRRKQELLIMGLRGELFSTKVIQQNRTYFFNVKENRMGDLYLNIVESKNKETGGFDRQSVILFADDLQEFLKGFDEALRVMEKEVRERRRGGRPVTRNTEGETKNGDRHGREERGGRDREHGDRGSRTGHSERPRKDRPPKEGKRVVVRKRRDEE
ncbi:MAG: DUF3276 family protein [Clostridiales bacterium]|nr:DUF3276 family protein [Clostridiales bacterium]